jgi:predicted RNA-binding Zn ribbon-like protein
MAHRHAALDLAGTIRHDGHGGVADDLETVAGFAGWLAGQTEVLDGAADVPADERNRLRVVALRQAVRTLFARAVLPDPPSRADVGRLLTPDAAIARLNAAAGAVARVPVLEWPADGPPLVRYGTAATDPATALLAALARTAIEFLGGEARERLRACPAPRCVRYFVQEHPRQAWCKPSCGNRARVARHYRRRHPGP